MSIEEIIMAEVRQHTDWITADDLVPAILAALDAAGYACVPLEPTLEQQNAGWGQIDQQGFAAEDTEVAPIYRAMLAARPR